MVTAFYSKYRGAGGSKTATEKKIQAGKHTSVKAGQADNNEKSSLQCFAQSYNGDSSLVTNNLLANNAAALLTISAYPLEVFQRISATQ